VIIEMRYGDVHVQRIPMAGKVVEIKGGGKELEGEVDLSDYWSEKMLPFQKMTVFETEIGRVAVRQITSHFANRIEVWIEPGVAVERGQRLGRVLAGSTVVIEMPESVELLVSEEDEVKGGETVIARYGR
jgi:phosphatidylserine decarboxylase